MTPEGRVKAGIDRAIRLLQEANEPLYVHKPVQNGMGAPTLDYVGCSRGRYFVIEAKAPGGSPTLRQQDTMDKVCNALGVAFVIDSAIGIDMFTDWVKSK